MGINENNKRVYPRIDARIMVKFKNNDEFATCYTQNISQGGIYLETEKLPDPNANIDIVLNMSSLVQKGGQNEMHLVGRVVRLMSVMIDGKPKHSVALQFIDVPPQTQIALDSLYSELSTSRA